jgi:hypothetical protein
LTREQIVEALEQGRLGMRIATERFPNGELNALFIRNWGWKEMQIPPKPDVALKRARSDGEAARFLNQATFGATAADIRQVRKLSYAAWLDAQFKKPATKHLTYVQKRRSELLLRSGGTTMALKGHGRKPGGRRHWRHPIKSGSAWLSR